MILKLKSDEVSGAVDTYGGELVSFVKNGVEYVWQGNPEYWNGKAPILFPVVCAAKDNVMSHDGVDYPMPKHGIARRNEFEPVYISKDRIKVEQRATEESLKKYPFYYVLTADHSISDKGFSTVFSVKNYDKKEMTFCIGGHPGFNVPMAPEDGEFEDYSIYFENTDGAVVSITKDSYMDDSVPKLDILKGKNKLPLRYSDYDRDALIIENLPVKSVKLVSEKTGHGIRFGFEGFNVLGIWTPMHKKAPFICLEPWNGLPANVSETTDAKSKKYALTLAPGEEYAVGYNVEII